MSLPTPEFKLVHKDDWSHSFQKLVSPLNTSTSTGLVASPENLHNLYNLHSFAGSSTSIRVLDLDAASNSSANPYSEDFISGKLRVVDLNDAPVFTALSYVWGEYSTSVRDVIECDGHRVEVTRNCWSALWHLRKAHGEIIIWVDAICINQNDAEEIKMQISLMGTIYPAAQLVFIWLGDGNKETDKGMDYLNTGGLPFDFLITRRVDGPIPGARMKMRIPTGNTMALRFAVYLFNCLLTFRMRPHYAALDEILSREWIKRLWTLQEALLATHAIIICGEKSISWVSMLYAVDYMDFWRCTDTGPQFPPSFVHWRQLMLLWRNLPVKNLGQPENHAIGFIDKKALETQLAEHRKYLKKGSTCHEFVYEYGLLALETIMSLLLVSNFGFVPLFVQKIARWVVLLSSVRFSMLLAAVNHFSTAKRFHSIVPFTNSESVMMEIHSRKSSKPEDKYYGNIGIIAPPQFTGPFKEFGMYSSLGGVYLALFIAVLNYTHSLDILLFTSGAKIDNSPSWIVDWRSNKQPWVKALYWYEKRETSFFESQRENTGLHRHRGAAIGGWYPPTLYLGTNQLLVKGVIVGKLGFVSPAFLETKVTCSYDHLLKGVQSFYEAWYDLNLDEIKTTVQAISRFLGTCDGDPEVKAHREQWMSVVRPGDESDLDGRPVFECIVDATKRLMSYNTFEKYEEDGRSVFKRIFDYIKMPRSYNTHGESPSFKFNPLTYHMWMTNFFASADMVLVNCWGLHSGFGVAPLGARKGDVVALISGVSMPMILREHEHNYEVVGPALLSGTLDGELLRQPLCKSRKYGEMVLV